MIEKKYDEMLSPGNFVAGAPLMREAYGWLADGPQSRGPMFDPREPPAWMLPRPLPGQSQCRRITHEAGNPWVAGKWREKVPEEPKAGKWWGWTAGGA